MTSPHASAPGNEGYEMAQLHQVGTHYDTHTSDWSGTIQVSEDPSPGTPTPGTAVSLYDQVPGRNSANQLTRVMSPSMQSNLMIEANQTVLLGPQCKCQVCNTMSPDPSLCANCGVYGWSSHMHRHTALPGLCLLSEMFDRGDVAVCVHERYGTPSTMAEFIVTSSLDLA